MSISYYVQTDFTYARWRSNSTSLKVQNNALVLDTRSITFKMSRYFYCKAQQNKSVILIMLCIKYKMNINSKQPPPTSPCIELEDPSWTIFSSTIIVAPYISIKLQKKSKWEFRWVVLLWCKLPILLAPLPVSCPLVATICVISIAWA